MKYFKCQHLYMCNMQHLAPFHLKQDITYRESFYLPYLNKTWQKNKIKQRHWVRKHYKRRSFCFWLLGYNIKILLCYCWKSIRHWRLYPFTFTFSPLQNFHLSAILLWNVFKLNFGPFKHENYLYNPPNSQFTNHFKSHNERLLINFHGKISES